MRRQRIEYITVLINVSTEEYVIPYPPSSPSVTNPICRFGPEQVIDRLDEGGDLLALVVLPAPHILDLLRQGFMCREDFSQLHECPER